MTTDRRLVRLAIAATEAGARFEREKLPVDASAWFLAPRRLFDGRAAIEACMERAGFQRNLLLHGLHLGLDAEASHIDELMDDDDESEGRDDARVNGIVSFESSGRAGRDGLPDQDPALWTCWLDTEHGGDRIFTFWATVSARPEDIVERVIGRFGREAAHLATFRKGFDHSTPLGVAMISDAMADTLALAASAPKSPLADGLDILVEQRFRA